MPGVRSQVQPGADAMSTVWASLWTPLRPIGSTSACCLRLPEPIRSARV